MAAYATESDLVARYDVDVIGELATDSRAPLSRADILTNSNVTKALLRASGEIDVTLRAGKLYTPSQLTTLDANSTEHLKDIVCCIAMAKLFQRRPGLHVEMAKAIREESSDYLDRLRKGQNILGIVDDDAHLDASVAELSTPTIAKIQTRNFIAHRMAGRHLPAVGDSHPTDKR